MREVCYCGIAMHPEAMKILASHYEVTDDESRIGECAAAICYGTPLSWFAEGKTANLKYIGCHSCEPGVEELAGQQGIRITYADSLWRTVAEHTLALLMSAVRDLIPADREVREGKWCEHVHIKERHSGHDFQNRTLCIWGMGQIGKELADMVRGFRMKVYYHDIVRLSEEKERELQVQYLPLPEFLAQADYLCILLPLNEETKGMVGAKDFAMLKKGCYFINTARAGIVDEEAFRAALSDGTLAGAALDVFWKEASEQEEYLAKDSRIVLSPHLGGSTYECDMVLVDAVLGKG